MNYICSEDGMKGCLLIHASSESEAKAIYRQRTGRTPDTVKKSTGWGGSGWGGSR